MLNLHELRPVELRVIEMSGCDISEQLIWSQILYRTRDTMRAERYSIKNMMLRDVIWRAFQDAMLTEKVLHIAKPSGFKSGHPEIFRSEEEVAAVVRAMQKDKITVGGALKPTVTAQQLSAYPYVMDWLRFSRSRNIATTKKAFAALASGMSQTRVAVMFGYSNRRAVESMRRLVLDNIEEHLREVVPKDFLTS